MTEVEKLKRRLESWERAMGPPWLMGGKAKTIAVLKAEIAKLERDRTP